jgi:hypothetical protein
LSIKPAAAACFFAQPAESVEDTPPDSAITEYEQALAQMRNALAENQPENRRVFLPKTYRMHPDITRFISEVSYNGRLTAETHSAGQGLMFQGPNDFNLPETGIRFIPCHHDACSQSSIEETELIRQLIPWLEKQSFRTKTGDSMPVTLDDILIVAPYNMMKSHTEFVVINRVHKKNFCNPRDKAP